MSDLVARLRGLAAAYDIPDCAEAADTITRLEAEVARMDAALLQIESGLPAGSTLVDGKHALWRDAYRDLQRIARITRAARADLTQEQNA